MPESFSEVCWIENFRMSHDVSAPWVALSQECKHTRWAAVCLAGSAQLGSKLNPVLPSC